MNVDKFSKLLGIILASLAFLGFGIFFMCTSFSNPVRSTEGWILTTATVKDVQVDTDPMSMTTTYKVWITYNDESDKEHFMLYGHDKGYKVGDLIPIKYDPNDPAMFADADATTINDSPLFGYIGIGLTVVGVLIPSVFFFKEIYTKKHQ